MGGVEKVLGKFGAELDEEAASRAVNTLLQIGYYRTDRVFVSLNLTGEQFRVIEAVRMAKSEGTLEELIVAAFKDAARWRYVRDRPDVLLLVCHGGDTGHIWIRLGNADAAVDRAMGKVASESSDISPKETL